MSLGFKHLALNTGSCHQLPGFNLGYDASLQVKTPIFEKAEGGWLSYRVTVRSAHRVCAMPYPMRACSVVSPRIIRIIKALERDRGGPDESCTRCCDTGMDMPELARGTSGWGWTHIPGTSEVYRNCYWKVKCAETIILKHCINITQNIKLSPFTWRAGTRLWGARRATIALGTFPLSSLALLKSQVPFWP